MLLKWGSIEIVTHSNHLEASLLEIHISYYGYAFLLSGWYGYSNRQKQLTYKCMLLILSCQVFMLLFSFLFFCIYSFRFRVLFVTKKETHSLDNDYSFTGDHFICILVFYLWSWFWRSSKTRKLWNDEAAITNWRILANLDRLPTSVFI